LTLAVLNEPNSRGGSQWVHHSISTGDVLQFRGPRNHFPFDETAGQVVFVAAGIGITPLIPMALKAKQLGIDYVLHYSGKSRKDMAFVDSLLSVHGNRLLLHISDEASRANYKIVLKDFSTEVQVYACGPQGLLTELESLCAGLPDVILKVEYFQGSANSLDPLHEHAFEIELKDSGLVVQVPPDRTVMEALRLVNIDVQSDCGEGLCGSCEVRVLSGKVDHRDKVLTATERQSHSKMMVCCSRAQGNRLVIEL
jgi:ferredoxin-NADP reductase